MAYKKGDLCIISEASLREDNGLEQSEDPYVYAPVDNRSDYNRVSLPVISLPHSCENWIIGGKEEALQLLEDIKEALNKL